MILPDGFDKNNVLHIKLDDEGCFNVVVKYNGVTLNQGELTVISLNCKSKICLLLVLFSLYSVVRIYITRSKK